MHTVERIEIEGFRGRTEKLTLRLGESVNFIIGRNGTGKTSLINLINAALSGDVMHLRKSNFVSIYIYLKASGSNKRPIISYKKIASSDGALEIAYAVQERAKDRPVYEHIEQVDKPWLDYYEASLLMSSKRMYASRRDRFSHSVVSDKLAKYVKTTWLSVYRDADKLESESDKSFESPIDLRLHQVFRKAATYFSVLDKDSAEKTDKFQTTYFLSLISPPKVNAFSGETTGISADEERLALTEMFSEFGLNRSAYSAKLDNFIRQVEKSLLWQNNKKAEGVPANIFLTLTDALRIDELVKEWRDLLDERANIYKPKSDFINVVNSLLFRKELNINEGNLPILTNENGETIPQDSLSSGEKQLLIILGEALVQRGESYIFMADEPELSLHIDWQEKLVPSIRTINPNAQIIFATHSPDIVGAYGDRTLNLEEVLG